MVGRRRVLNPKFSVYVSLDRPPGAGHELLQKLSQDPLQVPTAIFLSSEAPAPTSQEPEPPAGVRVGEEADVRAFSAKVQIQAKAILRAAARVDGAVAAAHEPPRGAEFILRCFLSKADRDARLGDLEEEYRDVMVPKFGAARARLWYRLQSLSLILRAAVVWGRKLALFGAFAKMLEWIGQFNRS